MFKNFKNKLFSNSSFRRIAKAVFDAVFIDVNIRTFELAEWVEEKSEWLELIRQWVRTQDRQIFAYLVDQGAVLNYKHQHNLITTVGRNVLCRLLAGDTTYSGQINYGALGTQSSPSPANSSTQLGTEVYRKIYSSHTTDGNNVAYVDFFYAATDTNGTYTEFGNFIDGTSSANTGRLFSYIATGGWTKSNLVSLFVSCQYTIN
jgi:hypothetical protein